MSVVVGRRIAESQSEPSGPRLKALLRSVDDCFHRITDHPVYQRVDTLQAVQTFMEYHVYAVWDFMSLLKALQTRLTSTTGPWHPVGDPKIRRLINEIVLEEESDEITPGVYSSHFELYVRAMTACGARTQPVCDVVGAIAHDSTSVFTVLERAPLPSEVHAFLSTTFDLVETAPTHAIAAAFAVGREACIPPMFTHLIQGLELHSPTALGLFRDYLTRHVVLDDERHAPMALEMLEHLCGDSDMAWTEAESAARRVLEARVALWDATHAAIVHRASWVV